MFNGRQFKNYSRVNKYNKKRKIKKIIYKCIYMRHEEKIRKGTNQNNFCNGL